jgi:hypothetical protein
MVAAALWLELRPEPIAEHPFAIVEIARGDPIGAENTEPRSVAEGLFQPLPLDPVASRAIAAGSPVLVSDVAGDDTVPPGWWIVSVEVPPTARPGDGVRVVLVDTGRVVEGIVAAGPTLDPLGGTPGAVAIPSDDAAVVAAAALEGRIALLISTG